MKMRNRTASLTLTLLAILPLTYMAGCVEGYTLVDAKPTPVAANAYNVQPSTAWNRMPKFYAPTKFEETWTHNGPLLESVAFIGGLPEGQALIRQTKKDEKRAPLFRADMTPQDLASMVEASYRIQGITVFNTESVDPVDFLGGKGVRVRYNYAPTDGMTKKGSAVLRVVDKKLYAMKLEGVSSHYYDAAVPEFDLLVSTATLPK
jgi:hypothetical protein